MTEKDMRTSWAKCLRAIAKLAVMAEERELAGLLVIYRKTLREALLGIDRMAWELDEALRERAEGEECPFETNPAQRASV